MILRTFAMLLLMFLSSASFAQSVFAEYEFDNTGQEKDFRSLTAQLRCLVCQNQNIADSNAPLAQDLRREIHEMLTSGDSRQDVIDFMVDRYGEFVLYKPIMSRKTLALWFGPLLFFAGGVLVLWRLTRKQKAAAGEPAASLVTSQAIAEARQLLDGSADNATNNASQHRDS